MKFDNEFRLGVTDVWIRACVNATRSGLQWDFLMKASVFETSFFQNEREIRIVRAWDPIPDSGKKLQRTNQFQIQISFNVVVKSKIY